MREIKFRGQAKERQVICGAVFSPEMGQLINWTVNFQERQWLEGSLLLRDGKSYIEFEHKIADVGGEYISCGYYKVEVIPETVGQFTGIQDKNGVDIYEGDIVRVKSYNHYFNVRVTYLQYGYLPFRIIDEKCGIGGIEPNECEVIGNVTDNPELLEEK